LHYTTRNVSVRPHQVTYFVRTFDALIKNICMTFFNNVHLHPVFLSGYFNGLTHFTNIYFTSNYALNDNDRMQWTRVSCISIPSLQHRLRVPTNSYPVVRFV